MEKDNHSEFVAGVTKMLSDRPDAGIIVLIHDQEGVTTLANTTDPLFSFGILHMAMAITQSRFLNSSHIASEIGSTSDLSKPTPKGGVN